MALSMTIACSTFRQFLTWRPVGLLMLWGLAALAATLSSEGAMTGVQLAWLTIPTLRRKSTLRATIGSTADISNDDSPLISLQLALANLNPEIAQHGERVAAKARGLGEQIGLTEGECSALEWAARLHDIGKVLIPSHLLLKSGCLNASEQAEVASHCQLGAEYLRERSPESTVTTAAILHHHERWDGAGYPHQLSGLSIPLFARIVAVVDAFDALTVDQPYRAALTGRQAMLVIIDGAGTHFDPELVTLFERYLTLAVATTPPQRISYESGSRHMLVTRRAEVEAARLPA